jgi:hypothetical protein
MPWQHNFLFKQTTIAGKCFGYALIYEHRLDSRTWESKRFRQSHRWQLPDEEITIDGSKQREARFGT